MIQPIIFSPNCVSFTVIHLKSIFCLLIGFCILFILENYNNVISEILFHMPAYSFAREIEEIFS